MGFFGFGNPVVDTATAVGGLALKIREAITGDESAETKIKRLELLLEEHKLQAGVNQAAASNPSVFVAGARSFIMWICGICFAFDVLLVPVWNGFAEFYELPILTPIDITVVLKFLAPMLGITF